MRSRDDNTTHLWLRKTDQYWQYIALDFLKGLLPIYLFFSMVLLFSNNHNDFLSQYVLLFFILALGGLIWSGGWYLRYQSIRCPRCGFNPTCSEAGDRRLSEKYMQAKLRHMTVCPRCKYA